MRVNSFGFTCFTAATSLVLTVVLPASGQAATRIFPPHPVEHPQQQLALSPDEQVRIQLYEQASPAVVTIETSQGGGSGSIITTAGLVLTNEHVVSRTYRGRVIVITATGDRHPGQVIATDRTQDLAIVQILSAKTFPTVSLSSNDSVRVGQQVYAIGSPFGLSGTLTTGILSRIAPNGDLQTDAAINQGNSGGPLLNSQGELIGVNKAIVTPNRGNVGIGFATSVERVKAFLDQHQAAIAEAATQARQPQPSLPIPEPQEPVQLGIEITPDLIIRGVARGSIAERVGLQPGDRLIAINQQRIRSLRDLQQFIQSQPSQALLTIARYRRLATVQVDFTEQKHPEGRSN
ncbi:MAG: trypsin-like peptidase domain-containing protein [Cyanobacteria bacterium P01_G01_bin.54]